MQKIAILTLTFKASGAVGAYRAVGFDGAQASVKGQKVLGVSGRDVQSGSYSDADALGTTIVRCGGSFHRGDSLIVDAQGRAVKASGQMALKAGNTPVTSVNANGTTIFEGADLPEYVFADALEDGEFDRLSEVLLRR
ncbi:hypothetical protein SAMN05880590_11489 [Rhizobium sp. RU35A]|uniref:DUF2190 family protein n=1 Tax=Rhizobium sp. RU35A TaxID=1907414 RepID=UPI000954729A|nr:DUF2190 family protein [Rhizobium sp. RU35A]SIR23017.1 hypothetical protein SAMN05880590_11489 [Rhizobium sp. RU35A]